MKIAMPFKRINEVSNLDQKLFSKNVIYYSNSYSALMQLINMQIGSESEIKIEYICRRFRYVAHSHALRVYGLPRKRSCAHARFTQLRS